MDVEKIKNTHIHYLFLDVYLKIHKCYWMSL